MKKNILICLFALTVIFFGLTGCTLAGAEIALIGTWSGDYSGSGFLGPAEITFNQDDTGKMELDDGALKDSFTVTKGDSYTRTITLNFKSWDSDGKYKYSINSDKLIIDDFKYGPYTLKLDLSK